MIFRDAGCGVAPVLATVLQQSIYGLVDGVLGYAAVSHGAVAHAASERGAGAAARYGANAASEFAADEPAAGAVCSMARLVLVLVWAQRFDAQPELPLTSGYLIQSV